MKRFDEMMKQFDIRTDADYRNALHEVMQQTALAGLARSGFFEVAAFYGGTCLHLFHGMQRFSEDLDFSLLQEDGSFTLETHFDAIRSEFAALGRSSSGFLTDEPCATACGRWVYRLPIAAFAVPKAPM